MVRVVAGTLGYSALYGVFLLAPAPKPVPPRAWLLLVVLLATRLVANLLVFRANPTIVRARENSLFQPGQPVLDRILLLSFMATFALVVSVASADGLGPRILGSIHPVVAVLGLLLFVFGWAISSSAVAANAFALTVVRPQDGQAIVTEGPYRHVRHPIYSGAILVMAGESLWLGSALAVACSAAPIAILVARIHFEELFLSSHTHGYSEYAKRVAYRLIPGIW